MDHRRTVIDQEEELSSVEMLQLSQLSEEVDKDELRSVKMFWKRRGYVSVLYPDRNDPVILPPPGLSRRSRGKVPLVIRKVEAPKVITGEIEAPTVIGEAPTIIKEAPTVIGEIEAPTIIGKAPTIIGEAPRRCSVEEIDKIVDDLLSGLKETLEMRQLARDEKNQLCSVQQLAEEVDEWDEEDQLCSVEEVDEEEEEEVDELARDEKNQLCSVQQLAEEVDERDEEDQLCSVEEVDEEDDAEEEEVDELGSEPEELGEEEVDEEDDAEVDHELGSEPEELFLFKMIQLVDELESESSREAKGNKERGKKKERKERGKKKERKVDHDNPDYWRAQSEKQVAASAAYLEEVYLDKWCDSLYKEIYLDKMLKELTQDGEYMYRHWDMVVNDSLLVAGVDEPLPDVINNWSLGYVKLTNWVNGWNWKEGMEMPTGCVGLFFSCGPCFRDLGPYGNIFGDIATTLQIFKVKLTSEVYPLEVYGEMTLICPRNLPTTVFCKDREQSQTITAKDPYLLLGPCTPRFIPPDYECLILARLILKGITPSHDKYLVVREWFKDKKSQDVPGKQHCGLELTHGIVTYSVWARITVTFVSGMISESSLKGYYFTASVGKLLGKEEVVLLDSRDGKGDGDILDGANFKLLREIICVENGGTLRVHIKHNDSSGTLEFSPAAKDREENKTVSMSSGNIGVFVKWCRYKDLSCNDI